jgi:hypothetical protein
MGDVMADPFAGVVGTGPSSTLNSMSGSNLIPLGAGGTNQYMNFPSMTATPTSGAATVPTIPSGVGTLPSTPSAPGTNQSNLTGGPGAVGAADKLPGGAGTVPTVDPLFTQSLDAWLQGQLGTGINPFTGSAYLPSTGGSTQPGQVAAPLTPLLQQLSQFLQTGQGGGAGAQSLLGLVNTGGLNGPLGTLSSTGGLTGGLGQLAQTGGQTGALGAIGQTGGLTGALGQMAQTGDPTNVTPEWQAMVAAQQNNIAQNQANLKEQFGSMGDLSSSSAANAMSLYNSQTAADQNSLLGQLQASASESAAGRMLSAQQGGVQAQLGALLPGLSTQLQALQGGVGTQLSADTSALGAQSGAANALFGSTGSLGTSLQGLDQQSIQNLMQEYFQTTPQENPLNNEVFGFGTTYPPSYTKQGGVGAGLVGSLPSMVSGVASGISDAGGGVLDTILGALGGI